MKDNDFIFFSRRLLHGMLHPEAGHILLSLKEGDDFAGVCPYHRNCFEGLASGPAIKARYGTEGYNLIDNERVWEREADYIGKALMQLLAATRE
ncbi:MAG: ROK family protein [Butyrivibrio sp.]|nr:ROK family protein [Butyrivibrio sp.]